MITYVDPIRILIELFEKKYPDKDCMVIFVNGINEQDGAYGETCWADDGIYIQVDCGISMTGVVEVLAHELAHVAAGADEAHGGKWENEFDSLNILFNNTMEKLLDGDNHG